MSENGTNGVQHPVVDNDAEDLEKKELELKRKARDPPIVFQDVINVGYLLKLLLSCPLRVSNVCFHKVKQCFIFVYALHIYPIWFLYKNKAQNINCDLSKGFLNNWFKFNCMYRK